MFVQATQPSKQVKPSQTMQKNVLMDQRISTSYLALTGAQEERSWHSDTKLFAVCELKLTMRPVSGMRIMGEYTSECPGWRGDIMRSVFWKKSEK